MSAPARCRIILMLVSCIAALVAGCATLPAISSPPTATLPPTAETNAKTTTETPAALAGTWSADTLFDLLVAEVAGQRGQPDVALEAWLRQAQQLRDPALAARATRAAWYTRSPEHVEQATTLWVALAPDSPEANANAIMGLIQADNIEAATPLLDRLLSGAKTRVHPGYIVQYAQAASPAVRARIATMLADIASRHAEQPGLWQARALLAEQDGHLDEALALVRRARALESADVGNVDSRSADPRSAELEGRLLAATGKLTAARQVLQKGGKRFPHDRDLRLTLLRVLLEDGRGEAARDELQNMLTIWSDDGDLTFSLALIEWETGSPAQARQRFVALAETGYREDEAWMYAGRIALAERNFTEAANLFQNVRGAQQFVSAQIQVAHAWQKTGRLADARHLIASLQQRLPTAGAELQIAASELEWQAGNGDAALAILDQAVESAPVDPALRYARAMAAERLNRIDIVEQDLGVILAAQPDNAMALNALGYTLTDRTDRHAEAKIHIERALAIAPNEASIIDSMGWVLFRLGRADEAIPWLRRAWALSPDGEIAAHLGEALWATGQHRAARKIWARALGRDPENRALQRILERYP